MDQATEPKDSNNVKLDDDLKACLKSLVELYEREDNYVRKQEIKLWKKNEEFWHGIQYIFWDEARQDWTSPNDTNYFNDENGREGMDGPFYDYVINIFRPHGEAVIAALGTQVPTVRFPPDDADDDDDVQTARTFNKISDLIDRHNQVKKLILQTLFFMWNQGTIYWYHAPKADKAFGMTHIENFEDQTTCSTCGYVAKEGSSEPNCPSCKTPLQQQTVLAGFTEAPKTRVMIDVYGGLHVKTPFTAMNQGDFGYLFLAKDQPVSFLREIYPDIEDDICADNTDRNSYERLGRTPSSFANSRRAEENNNNATHKQYWMRPWALNNLPKEKKAQRNQLRKLFPDGIYVAYVNDVFADARNEDMDRYWTTTKPGLSTHAHADPVGQPLISPQELRNTLVNLTAETIEQGIPATFADPEVLNFDVYSQHEGRPGQIYPAKPKPGKMLSEAFYDGSRATLSKEVSAFGQQLDKDAQFVVGSFPSLYGGPGEGKSRTLGEYQQSRQQALQRLSIIWQQFCIGWATMKERCVHLYVENMVEDEKYVVPNKDSKNDYSTVWLKKAEMTGKVGQVEPETGDNFPVSQMQKQALFFKLLEMNNEFINAALFDPENRRDLADLTGFNDLEIPGENQRCKQVAEINDILRGMQVNIDPEVDDHAIHIFTCKNFLVGQVGLALKKTDPILYQGILAHLQEHVQAQQQEQMQQAMHQVMAAGKIPPAGGPPQQGPQGPPKPPQQQGPQ